MAKFPNGKTMDKQVPGTRKVGFPIGKKKPAKPIIKREFMKGLTSILNALFIMGFAIMPSSLSDLRNRFLALSKIYHPDKGGNGKDQANIAWAYTYLKGKMGSQEDDVKPLAIEGVNDVEIEYLPWSDILYNGLKIGLENAEETYHATLKNGIVRLKNELEFLKGLYLRNLKVKEEESIGETLQRVYPELNGQVQDFLEKFYEGGIVGVFFNLSWEQQLPQGTTSSAVYNSIVDFRRELGEQFPARDEEDFGQRLVRRYLALFVENSDELLRMVQVYDTMNQTVEDLVEFYEERKAWHTNYRSLEEWSNDRDPKPSR